MKKMYVEPMGGMGNRFNCILSAIYNSRKYGYKLFLIWNRDLGCAIKLNQLLEPFDNVNVIELYRMGYRRVGGWMTVISTIRSQCYQKKCERKLDENFMRFEYPKLSQPEKNKIFEAEKIYISTSCGWITSEEMESLREEIKVKQEFIDEVNFILNNVDRDKLYGFHIRRTDHLVSINNCPTELFIKQMDRLIYEDSDVRFFVATDDNELYQELQTKYAANCIEKNNHSKCVVRNTKAGMKDAFVDVLCLSRCKRIYGSHSTFSYLAALLGNTELEVLEIPKVD